MRKMPRKFKVDHPRRHKHCFVHLAEMLRRVLVTSHQSHFNSLLAANFKTCVAWDKEAWLVCPLHKVCEYKKAVVTACMMQKEKSYCLPVDLVSTILELLGL